MTRAHETFWIVVADGARARVFERQASGLALVHESHSQEARRKTSEIVSDRPGRMPDPGPSGQRSAMELPTDPHRHAKDVHMRELARWLGEAVEAGRVAKLALVAAPQALGDLRAHLPAGAAARVTREVDKDLTWLDEHELAARLADLVG